MATNKNRNTARNKDSIGYFMKAGWSPESIKYSIAIITMAKITGTLTYDGNNFFIFLLFKWVIKLVV
ncbi:hypothetical protein GCM10022389_14180 [Flavobacterium cheonanense]|uniref:Uncharacterized protein n=1 Tax=Flavobacterium cheonanense TaxID=706183 RepID=A0ABP7VMI4_9FLAO